MSETQDSSRGFSLIKAIMTPFVCLALLGGAIGGVVWINLNEPIAERETATRKTAALVQTIAVEKGDYQPQLKVLGQVEPAQFISLRPRVSGEVIEMSPNLTPGGIVKRGEFLLKIDPADFEINLAMRESELKQVEADLAIEKGRQDVARQEFALLGDRIEAANQALVLREPQIQAMNAEVQAAQAMVDQAKLNLQRTTVVAPFDGKILEHEVDVGSQITPGDDLARLVGIDEYWVVTTVPLRDLKWIRFSDHGELGSKAILSSPSIWGPGVTREGRVWKLIGTVDDQTRLARVLVTVQDPLSRETDAPPLVIGTLVEVQIESMPIEDVVRLDLNDLRENDTVWVMKDGKLDIRPVQTVFRDSMYAYVSDGLEDGERIVTTTLATVAQGASLREATNTQPSKEQPVDE